MAPLSGKRVLVTRAVGQADELAAELTALGADVAAVPLLAFADPTDWTAADRALASIEAYHAAVFTSVNAVERFWARLQETVGSCDVPALPAGMRVFAVGPRTSAALQARGVDVESVPKEFRGEALAEELARALGDLRGVHVLLPRAEEGSEAFPARLQEAGGHVDVVPVYRTVLPESAPERLRSELSARRPDAVTLASGSAVDHLVTALGGAGAARDALQAVVLAALGPVTAARVRAHRLGEPVVAARARSADLAQAVAGALSKGRP